jgi:cytochrome b subunit of formate dehydrogenase
MSSRIVVEERKTSMSILRFGAQQRGQHILIITSVFVLALTGLPMKFFDWPSSQWFIGVLGGIDNVRAVHHYAAWLMIATCAYHLVSIIVARPFSLAMLPNFQDVKDFIQDMKHTFHLSKEPPQFDRFSYRNKAAYLMVYPGSLVMILTGLILLYPAGATSHLPGWAVPLALVLHSDAAVLAVGWLGMVHMYFAHFSRHAIPFDMSVITGKVPLERYKEEFPLEYARIIAAEGLATSPAPEAAPYEREEAPEFAKSLPEE